MLKYPLLLFFLLLPSVARAQLRGQPLIDSLLKVLPNFREDSNKVTILDDLSNAYKTIDPNEGIRYGLQELELVNSLAVAYGPNSLAIRNMTIDANNVLGLNYQYKSDYTKALEYFNRALVLCADQPTSGAYGTIISHLAVIYQEIGNYDKALEYNLKSLEIDKKIGNKVNIGGDYGNIGIIYLQKKDYEKALEYDFKSLEIFEQLGDKDGIAHNYGNIGNVYKELKNYPKALEYDMKALKLFQDMGDNGGVAINLGNVGGVYLAIAKQMDSVRQADEMLPSGTKGFFLDKATEYLTKSIELSKKIEQLDNVIEFNQGLYEVYLMEGNYKGALECYQEFTTLRDSVFSSENKLQIQNLETQREIAIKDKQLQIDKLKVVQRRHERIIYIIALGLLLVLIAVILRKFMAQKKHNRQLSTEKMKNLARIESQRIVLGDIAYTHSHEVSGQVATILGLVDVFNTEDYSDPDNKTVIDGIAETAVKLDDIVKDMIIMENELNRNSILSKQ